MNAVNTEMLVNLIRLVVAAGVVSLFMPVLVSIVVQSQWRREIKELAVVASCLVVGAMGMIATGNDLSNLIVVLPVMVVMTREAYRRYWKDTGLAQWIEQLTDVKPSETSA